MSVSDMQREQLAAFLGSLQTAPALRLFETLEAERIRAEIDEPGRPGNELLADLRAQLLERGVALPPRPLDAKRLFFTPFEDFFVGRRVGRKTRARISRTSLDPIWRVLMKDPACASAAKAARALNEALAGGGVVGAQELALFAAADAGLAKVIANAREDRRYEAELLGALGGAPAFDDMQEVAILVSGVDVLKQLQALTPATSQSLSEEQFYKFRDLFIAAHEQSKLIAGYVLLALKGRLEKPWRALRVYYHLARSADERIVAARDVIDQLPESLFEDLETMARALARAAEGSLEPEMAKLRASYFAEYADGLAKRAAKVGDNVFVNRIEACRDLGGEAFERFIEQAIASLRAALPVRHAGGASRLASLRPDIFAEIADKTLQDAESAAGLIDAAPALAARLRRDCAIAEAAADKARDMLRSYADRLVVEIRAGEGDNRDHARAALERTLTIAAVLLSRDEIKTLRDRAGDAALTV